MKLRQYPGLQRTQIKIDTADRAFSAANEQGLQTMPLYSEVNHPERVDLVQLAQGGRLAAEEHRGGAEIFLLEGQLSEGDAIYGPGSWLRFPAGPRPDLRGESACRFYFKRDHLPPIYA